MAVDFGQRKREKCFHQAAALPPALPAQAGHTQASTCWLTGCELHTHFHTTDTAHHTHTLSPHTAHTHCTPHTHTHTVTAHCTHPATLTHTHTHPHTHNTC